MGKQSMEWLREYPLEEIQVSEIEFALKLVSTFDKDGYPHISLITFNKAKSPKQVVWGQFTEGLSKKHVFDNPKQGILVMTAQMPFKFLQSKVRFTHTMVGGEDCEYFSRLKLLRYMTYVNVWRTFYNDVIAVRKVRGLGLVGLLNGIVVSGIVKGGARDKKAERKLSKFGYDLLNGAINPKYISYIDKNDGYPVIIPVFQLRAPDRSKLIFPLTQHKNDLLEIEENSKVGVYGVNFDYENHLVKGTFTGFQSFRGRKCGVIEIDMIYNSMPPIPGYMYPKLYERPKVTNFSL